MQTLLVCDVINRKLQLSELHLSKVIIFLTSECSIRVAKLSFEVVCTQLQSYKHFSYLMIPRNLDSSGSAVDLYRC